MGWGCSSVVEFQLSMCHTLASIPNMGGGGGEWQAQNEFSMSFKLNPLVSVSITLKTIHQGEVQVEIMDNSIFFKCIISQTAQERAL